MGNFYFSLDLFIVQRQKYQKGISRKVVILSYFQNLDQLGFCPPNLNITKRTCDNPPKCFAALHEIAAYEHKIACTSK